MKINVSFFVQCLLISSACLTAGVSLLLQSSRIEHELQQHGLAQAFLLAPPDRAPGIVDAQTTAQITSEPARLKSGLESVLSRASAQTLLSMPEVQSVTPILMTEQKLLLDHSREIDVKVFHTEAQFLRDYNLGKPELLQAGFYLVSPALYKQIPFSADTQVYAATLGMSEDMRQSFAEMLKGEDVNRYKAKISIAAEALTLPGGQGAFDYAMFAAGDPPTSNLPDGAISIPKIWLAVKLKEGVNLPETAQKLRAFANQARDLYGGQGLELSPMTRLFAEQLPLARLQQWEQRLQLGSALMVLVLLALFVLLGMVRLRTETALRRASGATLWQACWFACRANMLAMLTASLLSSLMALLFCWLRFPNIVSKLSLYFAGLNLLALVCALLLLSTSCVIARGELITKLKLAA